MIFLFWTESQYKIIIIIMTTIRYSDVMVLTKKIIFTQQWTSGINIILFNRDTFNNVTYYIALRVEYEEEKC